MSDQPTSAWGAYSIGDLALIGVGDLAWSKTIRTPRDENAGGIIVEIAARTDVDTGEVTRTFRTVDPYVAGYYTGRIPILAEHGLQAWNVLKEADISPEAGTRPQAVKLIRRLAATIGTHKAHVWLDQDAVNLRDLCALVRAIELR